MIKQTICTVCPKGCAVNVEFENGNVLNVCGNNCEKGKEFAVGEFTCPRRVVTSTVKVEGSDMLPVRTSGPVKKELIFDVMKKIKAVKVFTKVSLGDIIIENVDGEGTNLVASRSTL
ncbi:MAG: DUF1667 domain-containing protein [Clostridia bacterium]|nr:DUF1667 domain-containing protein [Clostridia bacterium]